MPTVHIQMARDHDEIRVARELARRGRLDLCVIGLGRNGHLLMNEPAPALAAGPHVARHDYAVEKAGSTRGWSFTIYEEAWNYGFHGEMAHFVDCVQNDGKPLVRGEDGRAVPEAVMAAYESARTGRKVALPFASKARKPIDLWWAPGEPMRTGEI